MIICNVNTGVFLRILFIIGAGIPFIHLIKKIVQDKLQLRITHHSTTLIGNIILYIGFTSLGITILQELGFKIATLLGAAGVFGVAIGFASQTSISNIISSIFLLLERSFSIDDIIKCNDVEGKIISIDLLSVKIKTSDNKLIRIPNETLLKQRVINITYYPTRRIDFEILVSFKEKSEFIINLIKNTASQNKYCLSSPEPTIYISKIIKREQDKESQMTVRLNIWIDKKNSLSLKKTIILELKKEFESKSIELLIDCIN